MTIGERIKHFRKEKNFTQKQLGEKCGIDEANIRKYESGKANPKLETLEKIAHALDVNVEIFLDLDTMKAELDDAFMSMYINENEVRKLTQKLIFESLDKLNVIGMNELIDYLDELLTDEILLSIFYNNDKLKAIVDKLK